MAKTKKEINYVEQHNKAVLRFQKTALFLLWAGVVSLIAILISVLRTDSGLGMALSINIFLNNLINGTSLSDVLKKLLIFIFALISGALFAALGYFARLGKLVFLLIGTSLYVLDFALTFFIYPLAFSNAFTFSIATHVVILGALGIAIYYYFRVIKLNISQGATINE